MGALDTKHGSTQASTCWLCGKPKRVFNYILSPKARLKLGIIQKVDDEDWVLAQEFIEPYASGKTESLLACPTCDAGSEWPRAMKTRRFSL